MFVGKLLPLDDIQLQTTILAGAGSENHSSCASEGGELGMITINAGVAFSINGPGVFR